MWHITSAAYNIWSPYTFPKEHAKEVGAQNVALCERNVNVGLQLAGCSTVFQTLTQAQIFDAYLYLVSGGSNTTVGIGESIVGMTALAILFPAASAVDRYDRGSICDVAAYAAAIAALLSIYAIVMDSIPVLFFSMLVWGFHWELCNSASDCIFVDSLPIVDRTRMITKKTIYQMLACSVGIALQLCFFYIFGNSWSIPMCKVILGIGYVFITPLVMEQLFVLKDRRFTPVRPYDTLNEDGFDSEEDSETMSTPCKEVTLSSPLLNRPIDQSKPQWSRNNTAESSYMDRDQMQLDRLGSWQQYIPYLVGTSDFIRAVGAGMTVKFFSLFFMNEYNFAPIHVTSLGIVYNLCIALFTQQANQLATRIGRTMTSTIYQVISVVLFFVLYNTYSLPWVIIIYLVRGSAGNAFTALDRAIVADTTKVKHRGKWMAVESLSHVTWSGSAFIGGLLIDSFDYRTTFLYTAFVYLAALVVYIPVAFLYPKSYDQPTQETLNPMVQICHLSLSEELEDSLDNDMALLKIENSVYQQRILVDTMSMSRNRGTSVASTLALAQHFQGEEMNARAKDGIRRTTNSVIAGRRRTASCFDAPGGKV